MVGAAEEAAASGARSRIVSVHEFSDTSGRFMTHHAHGAERRSALLFCPKVTPLWATRAERKPIFQSTTPHDIPFTDIGNETLVAIIM
jgi:hypothetical protein